MNNDLREFYNSSPMRDAVLCWYPFEDGKKYEIVIDPEDFSVEALKRYREKLGGHGRLLLAYENPFALRYWSGKRAPDTRIPYDTLCGRSYLPGKTELAARLKLAGFEGQKWYYPLTDHWFAREIYSEDYLPNEYLNQRFVPYIAYDDTLLFDERELYREVIRGGAFEFMCGAYLVEARVCAEDKPCVVDYAAVTAYREPSKRFATTVRSDGTVFKTPLHPDGMTNVTNLMRNHEELAKLGVNVVPLKLEGGSVVMPRLKLPTLWDYWAKKLTDGSFDEDEMFRQFDRIREDIYKTAKTGKCYWELVPANCFYDAENDKLIFFDQEYCWQDFTPDFAVARAIGALRYSTVFLEEPRAAIWIEQLKARYGLSERWEEFMTLASKTGEEVFGDGARALDQSTKQAMKRVRFLPVAEKLRVLGFSRPAVYGCGERGKELLDVLERNDIQPAAVIDRRYGSYKAIEEIPEQVDFDIIIVSIKDGGEIAQDLRGKTNVPVYTLEEFMKA